MTLQSPGRAPAAIKSDSQDSAFHKGYYAVSLVDFVMLRLYGIDVEDLLLSVK